MKLWIDDLRIAPPGWVWAKTSEQAITILDAFALDGTEPLDVVSFDHDLGDDDTTRPVVMWMIENDVRSETYFVHSANPVGREWLEGMIERYLA